MLSEAQLRQRQNGVSGSEAAALVGLSPWLAPIDIYRAKIDPVETQRLCDMESPLIRGILFEEPVIKWYSIISGRTVHKSDTLQHPKHKRIFATPDGIAKLAGFDDRVLEVKNTTFHSRDNWGRPGTDEIAEHYFPQVQFEMAVSGLMRTDVCVYAGVEPQIYHVDFDEEAFENLREICERFYVDHVIPRKPPAIDGSDSWARYVESSYPRAKRREVCENPDDDARALLGDLVEARRIVRDAEFEVARLSTALKMKIGETSGFDLPEVRVTWNDVRGRVKTDYERLISDLNVPKETLEKYQQIQPGYRRFLVTERGTQ